MQLTFAQKKFFFDSQLASKALNGFKFLAFDKNARVIKSLEKCGIVSIEETIDDIIKIIYTCKLTEKGSKILSSIGYLKSLPEQE